MAEGKAPVLRSQVFKPAVIVVAGLIPISLLACGSGKNNEKVRIEEDGRPHSSATSDHEVK